MKIITYAASLADEAPERFRCCAKILLANGELHPVICFAPTKSEARDKAEAFLAWEAGQKRAERMRQARQIGSAT